LAALEAVDTGRHRCSPYAAENTVSTVPPGNLVDETRARKAGKVFFFREKEAKKLCLFGLGAAASGEAHDPPFAKP
jgi:hypothetical protein